jgi:hypothetical protein
MNKNYINLWYKFKIWLLLQIQHHKKCQQSKPITFYLKIEM